MSNSKRANTGPVGKKLIGREALTSRIGKSREIKEKVIPALLECRKGYSTVGEIGDVFRDIFGEFR